MLDYGLEKKEVGLDQEIKNQVVIMAGEIYPFKSKLDGMEEAISLIKVEDEESLKSAVAVSGELSKLKNNIERKRKELTQPLFDGKKRVDSLANGLARRIDSFVAHINGKVKPYLQKKEQERLRKERQAEEARKKAEAEAREREEKERAIREAEEGRQRFEDARERYEMGKAKGEDEGHAARSVKPAIIPEVVPAETKVETSSGSARIEKVTKVYLEDPRQLSDSFMQSIKSNKTWWTALEKALTPLANQLVKQGFTEIPGFQVIKEDVLKTRTRG